MQLLDRQAQLEEKMERLQARILAMLRAGENEPYCRAFYALHEGVLVAPVWFYNEDAEGVRNLIAYPFFLRGNDLAALGREIALWKNLQFRLDNLGARILTRQMEQPQSGGED